MKWIQARRFALVGALLGLVSCTADFGPGMQSSLGGPYGRMDRRVPAEMPTTGAVKGQATYDLPIWVPGTDTYLSGFLVTRERSLFRDGDPFTKEGIAARGATAGDGTSRGRIDSFPVRWHNALLVDRTQGESWQLLDRRGFVSRWWVISRRDDLAFASQLMIFAATIEDSNGDGVLNNEDATVAWVTAGDGRGGRIVTPPGVQLNAVHYFDARGWVALEWRTDRDGDGQFEGEDPLHLYTFPLERALNGEIELQPWHGASAMAALEELYR